MGKILIYNLIDIVFELIRTQLYEYRSAVKDNKSMQKVDKRLSRITLIYNNLSKQELKLIKDEVKECYDIFNDLIDKMKKLTSETP